MTWKRFSGQQLKMARPWLKRKQRSKTFLRKPITWVCTLTICKGTYIIHILETSKIQTSTFQGTFQKVGAAAVWTSFWQITLENELRCQCWVEVSRGQQFNRSTEESSKFCLLTFNNIILSLQSLASLLSCLFFRIQLVDIGSA